MTRYLLRRLPSAAVVLVLASVADLRDDPAGAGRPGRHPGRPGRHPGGARAIRADLGLDQPAGDASTSTGSAAC